MTVDKREIEYGWIVDNGEKGGPQDGSYKIYSARHGKGVKVEHLGYSPGTMNPSSQDETHHGLDHGTLCMITTGGKDNYGTPSVTLLGVVPNTHKDEALVGNEFLNRVLPAIKKAYEDERGILPPPKTKETTKDGVKIRQVQERGKKHSIKLLNGIPSHGALFPMVGMVLPQVQNISTAVQSFNQILTPDIMSKLPGMNMSLGGMFDMMQGKLMNQVMDALPRDLQVGFTNMQGLIQSVEVSEGGGFSTGGKVDPTTFLNNAVSVLSQCRGLGDLVSALQRLQNDTSLFGLDALGTITQEIDTPFGKIQQTIDAAGNITSLLPDEVQKATQAFSSLMGSASGFPSIDPAKNMFGKSSAVMSEMFNRLPSSMQSAATKQMQQAVAPGSDPRKAVNLIENAAGSAKDIIGQIKFK